MKIVFIILFAATALLSIVFGTFFAIYVWALWTNPYYTEEEPTFCRDGALPAFLMVVSFAMAMLLWRTARKGA